MSRFILLVLLSLLSYQSFAIRKDSCCKGILTSLFMSLPDTVFKSNLLPYRVNFTQERRQTFFVDQLLAADSLIYRGCQLRIFLEGVEPSIIQLSRLSFQKRLYSLILSKEEELGTKSDIHIYYYNGKSLVDRTNRLLPQITLLDFINTKYLNKFSEAFINSPSISYHNINNSMDTLVVKFEVLDHPFFYQDNPEFQRSQSIYNIPEGEKVIIHEEVFLVWKKDKYVKIPPGKID